VSTRTDQVAEGIYRISTYDPAVAPPHGFTFNQFLLLADQPLLFHCGSRGMFQDVRSAVEAIIPLALLRWITFGHVEADECGAMNLWLAAAPNAQVLYNPLGCDVSLNDLADRAPVPLADGETLNLGGKQVRLIQTPHVPHGWEAQVIYEETTRTLFCGHLFTHVGDGPPVTESGIVSAALAAEDLFQATSLGPHTASTLRRLSQLQPATLALMHGSSFRGDCGAALSELADAYEQRLASAFQAA
jgi:flavorubredoxin